MNLHIKKYLLNRQVISEYDLFSKPFIWIHVDNELTQETGNHLILGQIEKLINPIWYTQLKVL